MCPQHRNVCDAPLCGSMSKHFTCPLVALRFEGTFLTFLPWQKHFTFRRLMCSLFAHICNAEKFHVLRKGTRFRTLLIVPLRRTSGCSVTLPGHMSIRVHRRTRDLRVILDKGAAGNTCHIVKLSLDHLSLTHIVHTYAGQALLRVRGRAMDLRAGLDGEDAGNTCRIIKSSPSKDVRKGALPRVPV